MKTQWIIAPKDDVSPQAAGIYVTLSPKGKFSIGRVAWERMDRPTAVQIFYDPPNNRLGLKPTVRGMKHAYPVCLNNKRTGNRVAWASSALQQFGIRLPATVRFYDAEIDTDGILVLDIRTARVPLTVINHPARRKADADRSAST